MAAIFRSRTIASRAAGAVATGLLVVFVAVAAPPGLQAQPASPAGGRHDAAAKKTNTPPTPPPGYVIGPSDVLSIVFWREKDMSTEVVVRPDGRISLPLLNDVPAAGLTPDELGRRLEARAKQFFDAPTVTVVVKEIHSRTVYITGQIARPGAYALGGRMTVLQMISTAGGLTEYAHEKDIVILRMEHGRLTRHRFNYHDVVRGKHVDEDIALRPGDTIVVP